MVLDGYYSRVGGSLMLPVTQQFHNAMTADVRRIVPAATVDYTDPFLDQTITIETSESEPKFPWGAQQTANVIETPTAKFAVLDGAWTLDGTWQLAYGSDRVQAGVEFNQHDTTQADFAQGVLTSVVATAANALELHSRVENLFISFASGVTNQCSVSLDGRNWTRRTMPVSASWGQGRWSGSRFCVLTGDSRSFVTTDGITWTQGNLPVVANWTGLAFGAGVFCAIAHNTSIAATSPDGVTWTQRTLPRVANWMHIEWSGTIFCAVVSGSLSPGEDIAATSTNGISWTQRSLPANRAWRGLTWGGGLFCVVAHQSNVCATSPDGATWTERNFPVTGWWWDVGHNGTIFCAVAISSNIAATSPDGVTWTQRTLPRNDSWQTVTPFGNMFCISAFSGTLTSIYGISWLQGTHISEWGSANLSTFPALYTEPSGNRISPVYSLDNVISVSSSEISWNQFLPFGSAIAIETSLSHDRGVNWAAWQTCVNGGTIAGIINGMATKDLRIRTRQSLSILPEGFISPQLLDMTVRIGTIPATVVNPAETGWWSAGISDVNGLFAVSPVLNFRFAPRPIHSLQVIGDSLRMEFPVDFDILLHSETAVLYTESIRGNTQVVWRITLPVIHNVARQELRILRWSHSGRCSKILESFSVIRENYDGDQIISIGLLEELETARGTLPIGGVSANELSLTLINENHKFDAGNKLSSLSGLIKPNRRVRAWAGAETSLGMEYVPLGLFWTGEWQVSQDKLTVSTRCLDRMEQLRLSIYETSQVLNTNLLGLAIHVLQDAGLTADDYLLDSALADWLVPNAYFDRMTHREAIRLITEACLGYAYCDREGRVKIVSTRQPHDVFVLPMMPTTPVTALNLGYQITDDNFFSQSRPQDWGQVANKIEVESQPLVTGAITELYRSPIPIELSAGQMEIVRVHFNEVPAVSVTASLTGAPAGTTIQLAEYFSWGARIGIHSASAGTCTLVLNGRALQRRDKEIAVATDQQSITQNGTLLYKFSANHLVQTPVIAQRLATMILAAYKDPAHDLTLQWRGNPALEVGDVVSVTEHGTTDRFKVVRQEIDIETGLQATLNGRKIKEGF